MSSSTQTLTIQEILWQNASAESTEYRKIQSKIKQTTGVDVSIESLKHMISLYQEIRKIR